MRDEVLKAAALQKIADSGVLPGQRWRHKDGDVYLVTAVGLFEPDLEPLVHYRRADDDYALIWTRQLHVFCGRALVEGAFVQRFVRVE